MRKNIFQKGLIVNIVFLIVTVNVASGLSANLSSQSTSTTNGNWLYVGGSGPGNYTKIQDAIDNTSKGDTVFVYNGIYYENIAIETEELTLIGEDKYDTTIHSNNPVENTIKINAVHVTLQGFTIENATGSPTLWDTSGIFICSSNAVVKDNVICDNRLGLCALSSAYNLTICDNIFRSDGILIGNYEHTPTNPDVTLDCFLYTLYNNTVNEKPLYYFKNMNNFIVPNDAGQVILSNCTNVTIKETYFTGCNFPIMLNYCHHCIVENNTVEDTYGEIITMRSENCTFQNNTIDNIIFGVCLDQKSKNNIIRNNKVTNSTGGMVVMIESKNNLVYDNNFVHNVLGIALRQGAYNNTFYRNSIEHNDIGLFLTGEPYDNSIENNSFIKNTLQVQSIGKTTNYYNNNYWNRHRILPKLIFGWLKGGQTNPIFTLPYCITGVDRHPQ